MLCCTNQSPMSAYRAEHYGERKEKGKGLFLVHSNQGVVFTECWVTGNHLSRLPIAGSSSTGREESRETNYFNPGNQIIVVFRIIIVQSKWRSFAKLHECGSHTLRGPLDPGATVTKVLRFKPVTSHLRTGGGKPW